MDELHITWHIDDFAVTINSQLIQFTHTEFSMLLPLRYGKAVPYAKLAYLVYGCGLDRNVRVWLDKHLDHMRKKVEGSGIRIGCVYGYGYVLLHDFPELEVKSVVVERHVAVEYVVEESVVVQNMFGESRAVDPVFGEFMEIIWYVDDQHTMTINWYANQHTITINMNKRLVIQLTPTEFEVLFPLRYGVLVPYAYLANEVCQCDLTEKVRDRLDRHIRSTRWKLVRSGISAYSVVGHGYILLPEL